MDRFGEREMSEKAKVAYADLGQYQRTMSPHFKQEWYGTQAKIMEQREDYIVVDYALTEIQSGYYPDHPLPERTI